MDPKDVSFGRMIQIVFNNKMTLMSSRERFIHSDWICVWCQYNMYIGLSYIKVPEDLRAEFLSPQQYEEYVKIIEEEH